MITYKEEYVKQVEVLLRCLSAIRNQSLFALKGGTAINLFVQNLPRLSVDIDLTYAHLDDREKSLIAMNIGLKNIADNIKKTNPGFLIKEKVDKESGMILKLFVYHKNTMVKIEPNFIMRGTLYPIVFDNLCANAQKQFNVFLDNVPLLHHSELYAGKICAALNRQHPRDLFDIKLLFERDGITSDIRSAFVVYLACDSRPINELLSPNRLDMSVSFSSEFQRMTEMSVEYKDLVHIREILIRHLQDSLTENERRFLLSIKMGEPQYDLMPYENLDRLPSLRWKLMNIKKMDKTKHSEMKNKLQRILNL